jgi:hypothetical protein
LNAIEEAILKTVLYADVFNFPLTVRELHHFLITAHTVPYEQVTYTLTTSAALSTLVEQVGGFVVCVGRRDLIPLREARERASQQLWGKALHYGGWLARLPFVRMVAITGALSMHNAESERDDLDFMLVTAPGRVWLARGMAVLLVRLAKRRGVVICPNYVVAQTALAQDRRDLFMAHEVVQMVPIYGLPIYEQMRVENHWTNEQLSNAAAPFYASETPPVQGIWALLKQGAEQVLGGILGTWVDRWEQRRKLRRFASDMQTPNHAAKLDDQQVKGHFRDHGYRVMQQYHERLLRCNLHAEERAALPLAGD